MKRTIEAIGTFDLNKVDMSLAGQIEIFLPVDEIGNQASKIVDDCLAQY